MPVKVESTPMLPGLSPVEWQDDRRRVLTALVCRPMGGLLALREVEQRLAIASAFGGLHP